MTETVSIYALRNGDIVQTHGGRFRLMNRRVWTPGADAESLVAFDSEVLEQGGIPDTYIGPNGWVIQGKNHATFVREV